MKKPKVGIITFHAALNFGSALQAYALCSALGELGCEAQIIDFILESDMQQYRLFQPKVYLQHPKAMVRDVLYLSMHRKRMKNFHAFASTYLPVTKRRFLAGKDDLSCLNEDFDAFICGSDQIWNMNCTGSVIPEFFLSFANGGKPKIAYAPSMPGAVSPEHYPQLIPAIERLDAVSVREAQTVSYLQDTVGVQKQIAHVIDPTLLLTAADYVQEFGLERKAGKYIFVYILDDDYSALVKQATRIARKTGLKIKYVAPRTVPQFFGARYAGAMGPVEFLDAIYNAAYVITNSFHAVVFSIHFHVPMCVFPRSGSESRVTGLLKDLDLEKNLYTPGNDAWMDSHADASTDQKRVQLAKKSLDFLSEHLPLKTENEKGSNQNE